MLVETKDINFTDISAHAHVVLFHGENEQEAWEIMLECASEMIVFKDASMRKMIMDFPSRGHVFLEMVELV